MNEEELKHLLENLQGYIDESRKDMKDWILNKEKINYQLESFEKYMYETRKELNNISKKQCVIETRQAIVYKVMGGTVFLVTTVILGILVHLIRTG